MNEWRRNLLVFLTTMLGAFAGMIPAMGCTGGCASCFQCAGVGGVMATLAAIGAARKKKQGKEDPGMVNHA
jgi:hypothetical protein